MFCVSSNFSISRFWFLLSVSSSTSYFRSSSCRVNKSHYSIIEESFLTYIKNSSTHFTILLNVNVLIFASFFSSNMHLTDSIIQTLPQKVGWDGVGFTCISCSNLCSCASHCRLIFAINSMPCFCSTRCRIFNSRMLAFLHSHNKTFFNQNL